VGGDDAHARSSGWRRSLGSPSSSRRAPPTAFSSPDVREEAGTSSRCIAAKNSLQRALAMSMPIAFGSHFTGRGRRPLRRLERGYGIRPFGWIEAIHSKRSGRLAATLCVYSLGTAKPVRSSRRLPVSS
jgi:hypothetical protein